MSDTPQTADDPHAPGADSLDGVSPEVRKHYGLSAEIERACEVMHDAYEAAAVQAGWETQQRSRVAWAEVPEANKVTMRVAVAALVDHLNPKTGDAKEA